MRRYLLFAAITVITAPVAPLLAKTLSAQNASKSQPAKAVDDVARPLPAGAVTIGGWLGGRMDACMEQRVMAQSIARMVEPFVKRDNASWASEYWGKWYTSAVFGYLYQPTAEHRAKIDQAARALLETQTPDGQITGFDASHQFGMNWDLWGRKYALLGLIMHYDATGDERSLQAAQKAADAIVAQVDQGMIIGEQCLDLFRGVQSTSILAEFAMLHARTGEQRYRKVAELIVEQYDIPNKIAPDGLRLMTDALADKAPVEIGDRKRYEVLANYEGMIELYRATGDDQYVKAVSMYLKNVLEHERMIHGSMSNNENWFNGVEKQTGVLEQPVETCVTTQWMLICWQMLRLTGDPKWADELELSLYNALSGVMMPDGRWWSYFAHLNGERIPSIVHHRHLTMTCCVSYGPKGLLLTPQWAVMKSEDGVNVNLYAPGSAKVQLDDGASVTVLQETSYPESGTVNLTINPTGQTKFKLRLRIPSWSQHTKLSVNGKAKECTPGQYMEIDRAWTGGDRVTLDLDMRVRTIEAPSGAPQLALARGPLLLALDNRLVKTSNHAVYIDTDDEGYVEAKKITPDSFDIWMAFEVPVYTINGPVRPKDKEFNLVFCDYPSAGNQWETTNQFRTWLPQPIHLRTAFHPEIWMLAYYYMGQRPTVPSETCPK